jgi:hypothetical protein
MVLFNGRHWHMAAATGHWNLDDRRIIMVGHGIRVDDTWHIYY